MVRGAVWIGQAVIAVSLLVSASCAGAQSEAPLPPQRPGAASGGSVSPPAENFEKWKRAFRARALANGIGAGIFDSAFSGVAPNPRVIELDRYQPEFTRPLWEYLDRAVSAERVENGRQAAAERRALLGQIEARYGVDMGIVAAIWGIESAYGERLGDIRVIESLATLAHDGRRREFAEEQLMAALRILQRGDVTPARMVGSWAGAMGHTQFIPTSFEAYAVDFAGDGRRDVWSADPADALASTANYLAQFGWQRGAPVAIRIALPQGFDYALADEANRNDAKEWEGLGVRRAGGGALPASDGVEILLPVGARGPAFAAYPNFRVIRRYNNATAYALAVALLAGQIDERIAFGLAPALDWPRGDRPLSRAETVELQERLSALGYLTQGADGIIGPNTRAAIRGFQQARGMVPDGYASAALLERVRAAAGG